MTRPILLLACFAFFLSVPCSALEYPTTGLIYNTKENSSLSYDCSLGSEDILSCDFIQTFVRKKATDEDWPAARDEALEQYEESIESFTQDKSFCSFVDSFMRVIESKEPPEKVAANTPLITDKEQFVQAMNSMSESEKEEQLLLFRRVNKLCDSPTRDNYIEFIKFQHDKDTKTCRVGSNAFKQKFKWVEDFESNGSWVVISEPSGPCGIVQLDYFEQTETSIGIVFWRYHAKKAITNKKGRAVLMPCDQLDEDEYLYSWKDDKGPRKLSCEYIEFSSL